MWSVEEVLWTTFILPRPWLKIAFPVVLATKESHATGLAVSGETVVGSGS